MTLFVGWLAHLRGSEPLDDPTTIGFVLALLAVHVFNWLLLVGLTFARGKPVGAILLFFFGSGPLYYPLLASILSHRLNRIHEANGFPTGSFSWPHHRRALPEASLPDLTPRVEDRGLSAGGQIPKKKPTPGVVGRVGLGAVALIAVYFGVEEARIERAYLYKQLTPDGLVCVFESKTPGLAYRNAVLIAEMHNKEFDGTLTVRLKRIQFWESY